MPIAKLNASSTAPRAALADWGLVGAPLSEPACALAGAKMALPLPHANEAGLWECTPGRYRRQVKSAELMHVLAGSARFTPDDGGEPVALAAGDVVFFPAHTHGIWDIESTVRKVYVLLGE